MKFLYAAFFLPISAFAFDVSDVQLVRMMNGQNVQCKETYEISRDSFFPERLSSSGNGDQAVFNVKMDFVVCAGDKTERHWDTRRPLEPVAFHDSDGLPGRLEFKSPEFVFGVEGSDAQQVVPVADSQVQTVTFRFLPSAYLSSGDQAKLNRGETLRVRARFLYRAIGTAFTSQGEIPLGTRFGASYTVFFTLKK